MFKLKFLEKAAGKKIFSQLPEEHYFTFKTLFNCINRLDVVDMGCLTEALTAYQKSDKSPKDQVSSVVKGFEISISKLQQKHDKQLKKK